MTYVFMMIAPPAGEHASKGAAAVLKPSQRELNEAQPRRLVAHLQARAS
jgi:hypothetical protein